MWLGIHISYKLIQWSQKGVVKHAQNEWKQQISYITKIDLGINLIFCMCLSISKYICMIQSIYMGVLNYNLACSK